MIVSLREYATTESAPQSDVCVIGGGTLGLFYAVLAGRRGLRVSVLECGGRVPSTAHDFGIQAAAGHSTYGGADQGRAFGLGGTSSRWGGVLLSYGPSEFSDPTDQSFPAVPGLAARMRSSAAQVRQVLGLMPLDEDAPPARSTLLGSQALLAARGIALRQAEWLPFAKRNMWTAFGIELERSENVVVWLDAMWKSFEFQRANGPARVVRVHATSADGKELVLSASRFVLAAGAIESTRMLLEMASGSSGGAPPPAADLGVGLSDHLSTPVARADGAHSDRVIRALGSTFSSGTMKTPRLVDHGSGGGKPAFFAHLVARRDDAGFDVARRFLLGRQKGIGRDVSFRDIASAGLGLFRLGFERYVRSRLYIPSAAELLLQLDIEQARNDGNVITLTDDLDTYGRRIARIDWRVTEVDWENVQWASSRILDAMNAGGELAGAFRPIAPADPLFRTTRDTFHPVGTCRMGDDARAVVSPEMVVRGTSNLAVLSTAVLPSAGSANPTFSLLCLAHALAHEPVG